MTPPHTLSVRGEADLLALIPYTLGFVPEESLVLVALGRDGIPFHARVDLPDEPPVIEEICAQLVAAACSNTSEAAFVVVYSDDPCLAVLVGHVLLSHLDRAGIAVLAALRADGSHWFPLPGSPRGDAVYDDCDHGIPYDIVTHPLTSHGVLQGQVTYGSRDELRESLEPVDPDLVDEVAKELTRLAPLPADRTLLSVEAAWMRDLVAMLLLGGADAVSLCQSADLARLLRAAAHPALRDLLWCDMTRDVALAHVSLWREVVRRSPVPGLAPAAALLAFSAWLAGNGALAWCAVDRALEDDPDQSLARLVGDVLTSAMPPSRWRPVPVDSLVE